MLQAVSGVSSLEHKMLGLRINKTSYWSGKWVCTHVCACVECIEVCVEGDAVNTWPELPENVSYLFKKEEMQGRERLFFLLLNSDVSSGPTTAIV